MDKNTQLWLEKDHGLGSNKLLWRDLLRVNALRTLSQSGRPGTSGTWSNYGAFKWCRVHRVHGRRPYERPPSNRTHDVVSRIYQKATSSRVVTCLLMFS